MNSAHFGFGLDCGPGETPSVGLNRHGNVVMVYEAANGRKRYRVGRLSRASIEWGTSRPGGDGETPRVALNGENIAVEVHRNPAHKTLYCRAGKLGASGEEVSWPHARRYAEGSNRIRPAVAMNDAGVVVEEHEVHEGRRVWLHYAVGQVKKAAGEHYVEWGERFRGAEASMPAVAVNNGGTVVEVHRYPYGSRDRRVFYTIGRVDGLTIAFRTRREIVLPNGVKANGYHPSVAITEDGLVIVVLRARTKVQVLELIGQVAADGNSITWHRWWYYDEGTRPSVAAAGTMAVEIHQHETQRALRFSTSIITDRVSWMQDRLDTLGTKSLRELVLPASHDAAMYTASSIAVHARTQNLTIYEQLGYGMRYFDLRPKWERISGMSKRRGRRPPRFELVIHHGQFRGPLLQEVLNDVRRFATEGGGKRQELVILKFSHFSRIDNEKYGRLITQVVDTLGKWLVKSKPDGKRLAEMTLNEYVKDGPAILVVVDEAFAVDNPREGFWVYRNWNARDAEKGDLRVYDRWSGTERLATMRKQQLERFADFNGTMEAAPKLPCDLFLLSWTLTPSAPAFNTPWLLSRRANPPLGHEIRPGHTPPQVPNEHGSIINLLYVDYVESARVTDVALFKNGEAAA
jgi:hypothetical protein